MPALPLPFPPPDPFALFASGFPAVLNHLLKQSDWARQRLSAFHAKSAVFVIPPLRLAITISTDGYVEGGRAQDLHVSDVTIYLPADTPFRLLQDLDRLMAEARVEGNAEFATELSFVLRHLRWDAEDDLSRFFGDALAHRLLQFGTSLLAWQQQFTASLTGNVTEYLSHENPFLLSAPAFADFRRDLLALETRLTNVEARFNAFVA